MKFCLFFLLCSLPLQAQSRHRVRFKALAEHVSLGIGIEAGVSQAAGGWHQYRVGLLSAGLVAGFKEGSDCMAGRDTKKQAAFHAFSILLGAGLVAAVKH